MAHDYHEGLPTYSDVQILHDGCAECEARAFREDHGISSLDQQNFARAWQRAAAWNTGGVPAVAAAEVPLLRALWAVQLQLERRGIPIGEVPRGR